jgi:hypothetical protein
MKLFTVLIAIAFIALFQSNTFSQEIPNAGFESWTNGEPDGWYTDNNLGVGTPVTQSSQSHSGSSAAKLAVVTFFNTNFPPYIWSGTGTYGEGFPVSQAYGSLTGYYQFNQVGNDIVYIDIWMKKDSNYVGAGGIEITAGNSGYTQFVVPILIYGDTPNNAFITIGISDSSGNGVDVGTYLLVDDLAFGGAVGVNDKAPAAESFQLKQNYPNPFNPSTTIEFSVPEESSVELKVYNILGVEVASLASGNYSPGDHKVRFDGENLASGIYLAKIIATAKADNHTFTKTVKMTLLK